MAFAEHDLSVLIGLVFYKYDVPLHRLEFPCIVFFVYVISGILLAMALMHFPVRFCISITGKPHL